MVILPGGRGRQSPAVASRIRVIIWKTAHSDALPCCALGQGCIEKNHTKDQPEGNHAPPPTPQQLVITHLHRQDRQFQLVFPP